MATEELAAKVNTETPWWATAPIWLAAGIVGVPSLIAIGAGYFLAHQVTGVLQQLDNYQVEEVELDKQLETQVREHNTANEEHWRIVTAFMDRTLQAEYELCVNTAHDDAARSRCLTPAQRAVEMGLREQQK